MTLFALLSGCILLFFKINIALKHVVCRNEYNSNVGGLAASLQIDADAFSVSWGLGLH